MSYRNELITSKTSEGIYGLLIALAFVYLSLSHTGFWYAVDIMMAITFVVAAIADFRRARQIRKEA